ncbi:hypothetical protein C8R47DRAFT_1163534 [Mycena vitilis]|nr:hypothetical protein C8R47DRAFT_1163534 [Mycena vitilis]
MRRQGKCIAYALQSICFTSVSLAENSLTHKGRLMWWLYLSNIGFFNPGTRMTDMIVTTHEAKYFSFHRWPPLRASMLRSSLRLIATLYFGSRILCSVAAGT